MSFRTAKTGPAMTTEYQASFRPPSKYTTITFISDLNPYHPLRGTGNNISAVRTRYIINQQARNPRQTGRPSVPPKNDLGTGQKLAHTTTTKSQRKVDYRTVYQNDFQAWIPEKLKPLRPKACIDQTDHPSKGGKNNFAANVKRKPFDAMSTYAMDYVPHPLQPRRNKALPVTQSRKVLPETRAANQEGPEFFQEFKICSAETEGLNPGAVRKFNTATYKAPNSQKSLVTMAIYQETEFLQEGGRTAATTQPNDSISKDGSLQDQSRALLRKSPRPKEINGAAKKCACDGMKNHQNPAETVGSPPIKFLSSMSWSRPLVGEVSWCSVSHT